MNTGAYSATEIQKQFWLMQQLNPADPTYNIFVGFTFEGDFDSLRFEKSVRHVLGQHDLFRTVYTDDNGQVTASLAPMSDTVFQRARTDATGKIDGIDVDTFIRKELKKPFHLETGPVIRFWLIEKPDQRYDFAMIFHHVVIDLHSANAVMGEIAAVYNFLKSSDSVPNLPKRPHFSEYVAWQREWMHSEAAAQMQENWKAHLAPQSGTLNLPLNASRTDHEAGRGDWLRFDLPAEVVHAVTEYSKKVGVYPYQILLGAYLVTLQKHAKQIDITVGVPLSNRRNAVQKDVLGCMMNILPIGFELAETDTFNDIIKKVRAGMLFAHRNQEAPLNGILKAVKPAPVPGMNPIYQVGYTLIDIQLPVLDGVAVSHRRVHNGGSQLDLFLTFWEMSERMNGYIEYDASLFAAASIERFYRRYERAVKVLCEAPERSLREVDILPRAEREYLVKELNQTAASLPGVCVHQLIEAQVLDTPDSIAVECRDYLMTYNELNERANRLAHYLISLGVKSQSLVGIHMNRTENMLVAVLAVMKAGGVYVPMDPLFPVVRLQHIVEETALPMMLTESSLKTPLTSDGLKRINLDELADTLSQQSSANCDVPVEPSMNAYVLFTSGSTGKPKGITIHNEAVVNFLLSMKKKPGMSACDVLLAVTTLSFDISVLELFLPLISGAKIVLAERHQAMDGEQLLQLLRDKWISVMQATPSTWQMLLASGLDNTRPLKILCGGEAMVPKLARQLCEISDDVWNMFGPTETTVWSTCAKVTSGVPISIGTPIDNTQLYIADAHLQLTPAGVAGELLIGGLGVGRGYLNRPELTAEKFIRDPYSDIPGNMVYRTGDLARYRHDGTLEFLGRTDFQVKIRGYRIELSEIENVLSRYPGIDQCAVTVFERNENDKRLVAWIATEPDKLDVADVRLWLQKELPVYMVPTIIQAIAQLPLTSNGKVDRKKLPVPNLDVAPEARNIVAPEGETEAVIHGIWQMVLGESNFGCTDRFFDVGGNSLLAIEAASKISKAVSRSLSVAEFFEYATIKSLADYLDHNDDAPSSAQMDRRARSRQAAFENRRSKSTSRRAPR